MRISVVAPHADDETLGCGGTLLKHIAAGDEVQWILVTEATDQWSETARQKFLVQIDAVSAAYRIAPVKLRFPAAALQPHLLPRLIGELTTRLEGSDIVYFPSETDLHTDHKIVHQAVISATKRMFQTELRVMEIPSETPPGFVPNLYVDISEFVSQKLHIWSQYKTEVQEPGNPRSTNAVASLAKWRGQESGCPYAETFRVIRRRG